jgi:hypothetical protein
MNRWTVLTVVAMLWLIAAAVNAIWFPSWGALAGMLLVILAAWWVVGGCARRGDPLARRLTHIHSS